MLASSAGDPEEYHVRAILFSGDTITGYIRNDVKTGLKNIFSKSGSIRQYVNISDQPKGGDSKRYSASELREYRFLESTEGYPDGEVCVSARINSPLPFKPNYNLRGFAWELDRRDSGSILQWQVWQSTGGQNPINRLVPVVGLRLKGARATYSLFINGGFSDALLLNYLKKQYPELKKAWEEYYHKGKDAKQHCQELKDNPSTALLFYEKFLETHEPLSDPEENKI